MLKIGLTGGIGAGKSTVAALFADRGVPVIDADAIAREVVEPGQPALAALAQRFDGVLHADGSLNRAALAQAAFADAESREALNAIMHPAIAERTRQRLAECAGAPIVVHDVPLLVENGLAGDYDLVMVVDVPREERLRRLVQLRGMSLEDARARMAHQVDDEARRAAADVVLDNTGTLEALREQFARVFAEVIEPRTAQCGAEPAADEAGD